MRVKVRGTWPYSRELAKRNPPSLLQLHGGFPQIVLQGTVVMFLLNKRSWTIRTIIFASDPALTLILVSSEFLIFNLAGGALTLSSGRSFEKVSVSILQAWVSKEGWK